jgi:hypothetical protein
MDKKEKKKVLCELCGAVIPKERLAILPETTTCVKCSQTQPYSGDDIRGLSFEELPDGVNIEDFDDGSEPDYSISPSDS